MKKAQLREWPWNNQPSKRHVWKEIRTGLDTGSSHTAHCQRCGRYFNSTADTRGPVYCYATPDWLIAHPMDSAKLGRPPFEGGAE